MTTTCRKVRWQYVGLVVLMGAFIGPGSVAGGDEHAIQARIRKVEDRIVLLEAQLNILMKILADRQRR